MFLFICFTDCRFVTYFRTTSHTQQLHIANNVLLEGSIDWLQDRHHQTLPDKKSMPCYVLHHSYRTKDAPFKMSSNLLAAYGSIIIQAISPIVAVRRRCTRAARP
jgi:hypothetical protein